MCGFDVEALQSASGFLVQRYSLCIFTDGKLMVSPLGLYTVFPVFSCMSNEYL